MFHLVWERADVPSEELQMAAGGATGTFWKNLLGLPRQRNRRGQVDDGTQQMWPLPDQFGRVPRVLQGGELLESTERTREDRGGGILKHLEADWTITLSVV